MSGISARENTRSAKRTRPSDSQARMAPPVLFRLPSVGAPSANMPDSTSAINASTMSTGAMAMPISSPVAQPQSASMAPPAAPSAEQLTANRVAAAAIAEEKAAGQRLLNVLIVLLLLAALVIITWISLQRPGASGDLAQSPSSDAGLEQLGDLKVPDVQTGQPATADELAHKNSANPVTEDLTTGLNLFPDQSIQPTPSAQPESAIAGLDVDIKEPEALGSTKKTTPSAQVQLRPPVPMGTSASSLVQHLAPNDGKAAADGQLLELEMSPPGSTRAETVSTPKSNSVNSSTTLELPEPGNSSATTPSDSATAGKPRTATNTGASPSLWDGAQNAKMDTQLSDSSASTGADSSSTRTSGLLISDPLSAQVAVPGHNVDASQQPTAGTTTQHSTSKEPSTAHAATTPNHAVTVGGGEIEPYNLSSTRTTTTPDFDSVTTIQQYQNYAQQQRLSGSQSTEAAPSAASPAATQAPRQPINSFAIGADTAIPGQKVTTNPFVKGSPINTYVANGQVPGGVTGPAAGPYVPSPAPTGQMPTGQPGQFTNPMPGQMNAQVPGQMVNGANYAPTTLPGYQVPAAGSVPGTVPNNGYNLPPRMPTQPGSQPGYGAPNYGPPAAGYPGGSGYPNPSYPSPSYSTQPSAALPGGMNPNAANNRQAPAYMPAGVQGSASYPVSNPNPAGPLPPSLMGPTGYATQPSGDFAPGRPVMGTMGSGVSLPNGIH